MKCEQELYRPLSNRHRTEGIIERGCFFSLGHTIERATGNPQLKENINENGLLYNVIWRFLCSCSLTLSKLTDTKFFAICFSNFLSHYFLTHIPTPTKLDDLLFHTHKFFRLYEAVCFLYLAYQPHFSKFDLNLHSPSQMPLSL